MSSTLPTNAEVGDAVARYLDLGFAPIPIEPRTKAPRLSGWPTLDVGNYEHPEQFHELFEGRGVGLLLGERSGGLVDVDLDSAEAVTIARAALPFTLLSGRPSSPGSHLWYRAKGAISTEKFIDPVATAASQGEMTSRTVLLEVRSGGAQTVVAPSMHPDGERYRWEGEFSDLTTVDADELRRDCLLVAAASLLARYWPSTGGRHDAAVALCGALMAGSDWWDDQTVKGFLNAVAVVGGDEEVPDRLAAVRTTRRRLSAESPVQGWPTLASIYEHSGAEDAVWRAREWIIDAVGDGDRTEGVTDVVVHGEDDHPTQDDVAVEGEDTEDDGQYAERTRAPWQPVPTQDITQGLFDGTHQPPTPTLLRMIGGQCLMYRSRLNVLFGPSGEGKTWAALVAAAQELLEGRRIMYVDLDGAIEDVVGRLLMLGVPPKVIIDGLDYVPFVTPFDTPGSELSHLVDDMLDDVALVIVDAVADWAHVHDGDVSDQQDAVRAFTALRWIANRTEGPAVIAIDHLPKDREGMRGPIGAQAKTAKVDGVMVWVEAIGRGLVKGQEGKLRLRLFKDRSGGLRAGKGMTVGKLVMDSTRDKPVSPGSQLERVYAHVEPRDGETMDVDEINDQTTSIEQAMSDVVYVLTRRGVIRSKTQLREEVKKVSPSSDHNSTDRAIEQLVAEGKIKVDRSGVSHSFGLATDPAMSHVE